MSETKTAPFAWPRDLQGHEVAYLVPNVEKRAVRTGGGANEGTVLPYLTKDVDGESVPIMVSARAAFRMDWPTELVKPGAKVFLPFAPSDQPVVVEIPADAVLVEPTP